VSTPQTNPDEIAERYALPLLINLRAHLNDLLVDLLGLGKTTNALKETPIRIECVTILAVDSCARKGVFGVSKIAGVRELFGLEEQRVSLRLRNGCPHLCRRVHRGERGSSIRLPPSDGSGLLG